MTVSRRAVVDAVEVQLRNEPLVPTRNRKPMRANAFATFELRIGSLRAYYDVLSGLSRQCWLSRWA